VIGALSARRRAAALILESTFTSIPDVASEWHVPELLIADRFDTRRAIATQPAPILIIHGVDDALIPFKHARELARVGARGSVLAVRAAHNDLPHTERGFWDPIRELLSRALR